MAHHLTTLVFNLLICKMELVSAYSSLGFNCVEKKATLANINTKGFYKRILDFLKEIEN